MCALHTYALLHISCMHPYTKHACIRIFHIYTLYIYMRHFHNTRICPLPHICPSTYVSVNLHTSSYICTLYLHTSPYIFTLHLCTSPHVCTTSVILHTPHICWNIGFLVPSNQHKDEKMIIVYLPWLPGAYAAVGVAVIRGDGTSGAYLAVSVEVIRGDDKQGSFKAVSVEVYGEMTKWVICGRGEEQWWFEGMKT